MNTQYQPSEGEKLIRTLYESRDKFADECDQLRAINAQLRAALEWALSKFTDGRFPPYDAGQLANARTVLAAAKAGGK